MPDLLDPKNYQIEGGWERLQRRMAALLRKEVPVEGYLPPVEIPNMAKALRGRKRVETLDTLQDLEGAKSFAPWL